MCSMTSCIHTSHTIFADVVCIKLAFFPPVWAPRHSSQRLSNSLGFLPCSNIPGTVFSGIEFFLRHLWLNTALYTYLYVVYLVYNTKSKWKWQEAFRNNIKHFCKCGQISPTFSMGKREELTHRAVSASREPIVPSLPLCKSHSLQDTTLRNLWQCGDCLQLRH